MSLRYRVEKNTRYAVIEYSKQYEVFVFTYRYITFLILFVSFTSCDRPAVDQTEILWDEWGVPHIYARNTAELFYATGWAQMESHGNLILRLYGESRGRAAEYWGERYFESDRWIRTMEIPDRADIWYQLQTDEFKEYLKAFTDGINDYVSEHPDLIDTSIRKSVHGPVIIQNEYHAVALRVAGLNAEFMIDQWWRMGRANNLEEFKTQLKRMQLPMFTVIYADREGNIMHFFAGTVPDRKKGDWNFWQGMVPGDTPETLWSDIHPYEDLPLILNPPTGWLQNANDPPWTTTFPLELHPDDYPPYMAPVEYGFRAQQSAHLLMDNDGLSFHQLADLKHNTRMKLADRVLDELLVAVGLYGNNTGRRAAGFLSEWDRTADADSRGAFLFEQWAWNYNIWQNFEIPFSLEEPFTTPSGLADPQGAVRALERVAERIESTYGSIDVKWGDVYRLRIDDHDFPVSGGPGNLGIFRVFGYDRAPTEDNQYIVNFGDSFVAAVEFSNPLRAQVLTAYGNATQRHLPHRGDQLELLASKQMRDALLTREEVEANSITRIRLK